jgi:hypothetical protein
MQHSRTTHNIKSTILSLVVGLFLAAGITYAWNATWHGTSWISSGETISAQKVAENFEYLKAQISSADSIWALNGTSAYYTGGNVGVGRSNPTVALEVGDGTGWEQFVVHGVSGYSTGLNGNQLWSTNGPLHVNYGNNNNVLISALGTSKVGIGTLIPSSRLEVDGHIEADAYCDRNGDNCFSGSGSAQTGSIVAGCEAFMGGSGDNTCWGGATPTSNFMFPGTCPSGSTQRVMSVIVRYGEADHRYKVDSFICIKN